ncbi:MAG: CocE/NonD family hydrolase [Solirubrobacterales bacterium]
MSDQDPTTLPFGLPLPAEPPRRWLEPQLHPDLGAPRTIEVDVPMRDGVLLAADVHLPAAERLPAPAIVIGTPYDKSSPFDNGLAYRDAGYVAVVYDSRGRGKSEGEWHAFAEHDGPDGHDVVEWAARQPWCSGEVGVSGISYLGWVVWATVAAKPPHLKAAVSTAAAGRWQQEIPYTYGCLQLYFAHWHSLTRRRITDASQPMDALATLPFAAIGERFEIEGPGWRDLLEHEALDEMWRSRRWDGEYAFDVPTLHVSGWHDREDIQGAFHHYEQMLAASPARADQYLLVGPWSHVETRFPDDSYDGVPYPGGGVEMDAIHVRFFDRFLRGENNGVQDEPRVRLYDTGARRWQVREGWQEGTAERDFFLDGGGLSAEPGEAAAATYRYDPLSPNGIPFDVEAFIWEPTLDLAVLEAQAGVLAWSSEPLAEPLTVHGWGEVELWAESDREDTELHVKLADVGADGRALQVAWGCLRASHAEDPTSPAAIAPGEVRGYAIELTPAFHTFEAGHRLRLLLAGSEYPWFARNLNRFEPVALQAEPLVATNTVHSGAEHPSRLRLRVEG